MHVPGRLAGAGGSACALMPGADVDPVFLTQIALVVVIFHALLLSAAGMVWAERKVAARLQQRFGPTYTGFAGLLQPFADVFKLFFKEELRPAAADKILFYLAP